MSHTLYVRLRKAEGALVRLLGQIGRRGYDVLNMTVRLTDDGKAFEALIEFDPIVASPPAKPIFRPPELAVNLVSKLYEVEKAELRGPASAAQGPAAAGKLVDSDDAEAACPPKHSPDTCEGGSGNGSASDASKKPTGKPAGEMHWEE